MNPASFSWILRSGAALLLALSLAAPAPAAPLTQRTAQLQAKAERLVAHLSLRQSAQVDGDREFDQRYAAVAQALDAWNASQRADADADIMETWLDHAIRSAMLGGKHALPPAPQFPALTPAPTDFELPAPMAEPTPVVEAAPMDAGEPFAEAEPTVETNPLAEAESSQPEPPLAPMPPREKSVVAAPPQPAPRPIVAAPVEQPPLGVDAEPEPEPPVVEETAALAWSDHPASTPLDWGDPFADDQPPTPADSAPPSLESRFKPVAQEQPVDGSRVKIDLLELSSRVAGHNSKLRELEGLLLGSRDLSAFRLAAVVRDLEGLQQQRSFLRLYVMGLSPEEAALGPRLDTLDTVQRFLDNSIAERSEIVAGKSDSQSQAEQAILAALERKMDELRSE